MRVLFVYPNSISAPFLIYGITILSGVLRKAGHVTSLFDTTFYDMPVVGDTALKEKNLEFKRIKSGHYAFQKELVDIKEKFRERIIEFKPDLIAVSCVSSEFDFLLSFLYVKKEFKIPVIIGGVHPTVASEEVINNDCIDMICIGEGEGALLELTEGLEAGKDISKIRNLWIKKGDRVFKNELRPLIQDLNSLPYPDWSIFDERHLIKPFRGEIYRWGYFLFGRGCPFHCSYCINPNLQSIYKGKGKFHREKTAKAMVDEIKYFVKKYKINFIEFIDETLLVFPVKKLREFSDLYKKYINLPFYLFSRAETVSEEKAKILSELNCKAIGIGIETGNERLRREMCNKKTTDKQFYDAARLLQKYNIKLVSYNMIGLPYETRDQILDTVRINKRLKSSPAIVYYFYPFKGTPLRELCIKNGFLDKEGEGYARPTFDTPLKMPQISVQELRGLKRVFPIYLRTPEVIWPIIRSCEKDDILGRFLYRIFINFLDFKFNYLERD